MLLVLKWCCFQFVPLLFFQTDHRFLKSRWQRELILLLYGGECFYPSLGPLLRVLYFFSAQLYKHVHRIVCFFFFFSRLGNPSLGWRKIQVGKSRGRRPVNTVSSTMEFFGRKNSNGVSGETAPKCFSFSKSSSKKATESVDANWCSWIAKRNSTM